MAQRYSITRRLLSVLLGGLLLSACSPQEESESYPPRPVKTFIVGGASSTETLSLPGKIRAADKVDLSFQVSGQVNTINVLNGQEVKKGQILAELDQRDFLSDLKAAEAEYNRASADFERMGVLVQRQLISQAEYDAKKAQRDIAEARLERARKALADTQLKAPFYGIISNRYVEKFEDITAKQPILSLQNPSNFEVVVNVAENTILRLQQYKDQATIWAVFDAFPGQRFPLTIKEYATEANPVTQTFEAVMVMERPEGLNLFSGLSVTAVGEFDTGTQDKRFWIPSTAVFADPAGGDQQYVWQLDEASMTVRPVVVALGGLRSNEVEILSGLQAGDQVVIAGVHHLHAGEQVRLFDTVGE